MAQVGTITKISGLVEAVASDGSTRVLALGDAVNLNEQIVTIGTDSSVQISFPDGRMASLGGDEQGLLDDSVVTSAQFPEADVQATQQALLDGGQLPTDPTALGQDAPADDGGIVPAFTAERTDARGDVGVHNLGTDRLSPAGPDGNGNEQVNQAPEAADDFGLADEDVVFTGNVLDNDVDDGLPNPDSDLDVVSVNGILPDADGNIIVTTDFGTLTLNAETGDYTYLSFNDSLAWDETTLESFEYVVTDGLLTDTATLNITLDGTNDRPDVADVNLGGHLDRFTFDGENPTFYNNGSNSYNGMSTIGNDRIQKIDGTTAEVTLETKLPSGSTDWDGVKIYLYKGEVLTLTSDSGSKEYYIGIDDSDHSNGTPDPVTGAFKWDTLALTTEAGQTVSVTASSDGWYYIGTGAISGENSPYGLYETKITINGQEIIYETHDADSTDGDTIDDGINVISGTLSATDLDLSDTHLFRLVPLETQNDNLPQYDYARTASNSNEGIIEIGYIDANDSSLNENSTVQVEITQSDVNISDLDIQSIELFNNDAVDSKSDFEIKGDFSALGAGETVTLRLQYIADDTNGFTDGQLPDENSISEPAYITVTITGTNDQPVAIDDSQFPDGEYSVLTINSDDWSPSGVAISVGNKWGGTDGLVETSDGLGVNTPHWIDGDDIQETAINHDNDEMIIFEFDKVYNESKIVLSKFDGDDVAEYTLYLKGQEVDIGRVHLSTDPTISVSGIFFDQIVITAVDSDQQWGYSDFKIESVEVKNNLLVTEENTTLKIDVLANDYDVDTSDSLIIHDTNYTPDGDSSVSIVNNQLEFNPGTDFDYLGVGETAEVTFQYRVDDQKGFGETGDLHNEASISEWATVTFTVIGTNDQPQIDKIETTGSLSEADGMATLTTNGAIAISDLDVNDTLTLESSYNGDIAWSGEDQDSSLADLVNVNALIDSFSVNTNDASAPTGDGVWTYTTSQNLDFLANGETITLSYDIVVKDDSDAANDTSTSQTVNITITGTNDAPVAVNDSTVNTTNTFDVNNTDGVNITAFSGNNSTDVDVINNEFWGIKNGKWDSSQVDGYGPDEKLVFTFDEAVDSATVTLGYMGSNDDATWKAYNSIGTLISSGETDQSSIEISGSDIVKIELSVAGYNDDYYVKSIETTTHTPLETLENNALTIDVLANDYDLDVNDSISINNFDTTATLTGVVDDQQNPVTGGTISEVNGELVFTPGTDFDYLAVGQTQEVTFTYDVIDTSNPTHEVSNRATVTVIVTGTNDLPVAVYDELQTVSGGLAGEYYGYNEGPDGGNLESISQVQSFIDTNEPNAEFISTEIDYRMLDHNANHDLAKDDHLQQFLNNDAASLSVNPEDATDGIIHISGQINISEAGDYTIKAEYDDGFQIKIDGNVVASYDGITPIDNDTFYITGLSEGMHDVDVIYWDQAGHYYIDVSMFKSGDVTETNIWVAENLSHTIPLSVGEDSSILVDVLDNDYDIDTSDTISINTYDTTSSGGGIVSLESGELRFTPGSDFDYLSAGESAEVTFSYDIKDNHGAVSSPAIVTITVVGANDGPAAATDFVITNVWRHIDVPEEALLANDTDPDMNDTLHVQGGNVHMHHLGSDINKSYTVVDSMGATALGNIELDYQSGDNLVGTGRDEIFITNDSENDVNAKGGNDQIYYSGDMEDRADVYAGDGDDTLNIGRDILYEDNYELNINMGSGNDIINVERDIFSEDDDGKIIINTENGNDTINVGDDIIGDDGDLIINMGSGNDVLNVEDNIYVNHDKGDIRINMDSGNDELNVGNDIYSSDGEIKINMGSNNDVLNVGDDIIGHSGGDVKIDMGSGNDMLTVGGHIDGMYGGDVEIEMGSGNDTVEFTGKGTDNDGERIESGASIDFGDGEDTLIFDNGATTLNLSRVENLEIIELKGSNITSDITVDDVFGATDGNNELTVTGDGTSSVNVDGSATAGGTDEWGTGVDNGTTTTYTATHIDAGITYTVTLNIDNDITHIV